jgi:hypothetical protein
MLPLQPPEMHEPGVATTSCGLFSDILIHFILPTQILLVHTSADYQSSLFATVRTGIALYQTTLWWI